MTAAELERTWSHLASAELEHDAPHARRAWAALVAAGVIPREPYEPDTADCG